MAGLTGLQRTLIGLQQIWQQAFAASAKVAPNVGAGASMGAIGNATGQLGLALQAQIDYVATLARLFDANGNLQVAGPDVDSAISPYVGDRLPAISATTTVTASIPSPSSQPVTVPVGLILQRQTDGVQYVVVADASQSSFQNGAYVVSPGGTSQQTSCSITVACLSAGSIGNTPANTITQVYGGAGNPQSSNVGVTNPFDVINGSDAEDDLDYVGRFQLEMQGGSLGTNAAIRKAALSTQAGLVVQIGDGFDASGNPLNGQITIFANVTGQSAGPSQALLAAIAPNVEAVRPAGTQFTVNAPTLLSIVVGASVKLDGTQPWSAVEPAVNSAIADYVNGIGMVPFWTRTSQPTVVVSFALLIRAMLAVPGVAYVSTIEINGAPNDIAIGYGTQAIAQPANLSPE